MLPEPHTFHIVCELSVTESPSALGISTDLILACPFVVQSSKVQDLIDDSNLCLLKRCNATIASSSLTLPLPLELGIARRTSPLIGEKTITVPFFLATPSNWSCSRSIMEVASTHLEESGAPHRSTTAGASFCSPPRASITVQNYSTSKVKARRRGQPGLSAVIVRGMVASSTWG
nr:hypothetical protein Iba_chr07fCG7760 [Ipomoea batatas]